MALPRTLTTAALLAWLSAAAAACVGNGLDGVDGLESAQSGNDALAADGNAPTPADDGNALGTDANAAGGQDSNTATSGGNANAAAGNVVVGPAEVSSAGDGNFSAGPSFTVDANLNALNAGVAPGTWSTFYLSGANSNYYTGKTDGQNVTINRQVQVFVPAQYVSGTPAPLLVLMDGGDFQYTLKYTLPNLIAAKALPPLVAITVSAGSAAGYMNQRSLEYDVVSNRWGDYIENEILPQVQKRYNVTISQNPALRGTLGGSSGGACAITMGWLRPDRYSRLVTFSASLVDLWGNADYPAGAWFYPNNGIANAAKKNLRISLSAGQNDLNAGTNNNTDWLLANNKTWAALKQKGYHYRFTYVVGGGHESAGALKQNIPTELAWAWRGWEQATP